MGFISEVNSEESFDESENVEESGQKRKNADSRKSNKKKQRLQLHKQLTSDELNELKETENLYSSSLMRLQIDDLMGKLRIGDKKQKKIQKFWKLLKDNLDNIDLKISKPLNEIKLNKTHKEYNCNKLKTDKNLEIKFEKPEQCSLFGAYALNCLTEVNNVINVNVSVTMPSDCFQEKDYLNNRYLVRRNYYLTFLCIDLREKMKDVNISIKYYGGIVYSSYICIQPILKANVNFNLFAIPSETIFKLGRCLPDKSNIKFSFDDNFTDVNIKDCDKFTTPLYNSILGRDFTLNANSEWLQTKINSKNVQDGICLASTWLHLRELNSFTGFTSNILHSTISYLINKRMINEHMSPYQIVRIFWNFLSCSSWNEESISLLDNVNEHTLKMFKENFDIVFLDVTGSFNLTAFLDIDNYLKVKNEAQKAITILDSNNFNSFVYLFNTKMPHMLQFDAIVKIHRQHNIQNVYLQSSTSEKWKYYGFYDLLITKKIKDLLRRGLGDRVTHMVPSHRKKKDDSEEIVVIGLTLNTSKAFSIIERGPSEENPKDVEKFRKFWGRFSDFRRFQDSTAAQVAIFPYKTVKDRRNIFVTIVNYVLEEKYSLGVEVVANQLEEVITDKATQAPWPTGTNEEASLKIKQIHDDLTTKIRELKIQLTINSIQGVGSVFCYTEAFPPIPKNYKCSNKITTTQGNNIVFKDDINLTLVPDYVYPIKSIIYLARSSAWPNNLEAVQAIKCEFYFKIADMLKEEYGVISNVKYEHLDVLYEGLVFRFQLFVPKEASLLKKTVDTNGVTIYKESKESLQLEKELEILPKLTSALNGIQQGNPSFGSTCVLVKRWLRSQMIDDFYVSDTVIDLWVASHYVNESPFERPNLPQVGFLRFLKYLSTFDANTDLVIVNFNEDIEKSKQEELEATFINNRQALPNLYIITPYDNGQSIFTKEQPNKDILSRITLLAELSYKYLSELATDWQPFYGIAIFKPPSLDGYDVVINLNNDLNPLQSQRITFTGLVNTVPADADDKKVSNVMPIVDFNPITKYLSEIRQIYEKYALFFHDSYGGITIGILWIESELTPKDKVPNLIGKKTSNKKRYLTTDLIMEDIINRGKGLIKSVDKV